MATADPGVGSWTPINIFAMIRALVNNGCPIVSNAGAPTNGASGTFVGQAGPGAILIDYTNSVLYMNTNTLASPTWTKIFVGASGQIAFTALSVNGAVPITASANFVITKAGVLVDTVAAPAASPGGDGIVLTFTSDTANAHTLTFTGNTLDTGSASVLTATFNANKGASLTVVSYNARWKVVSANGVSFT